MTDTATENKELFRRFLFGDMEENERDSFEERLFEDSDLFYSLADFENEVVDRYVSGSLGADEEPRLKAALADSPSLRRKLAQAEALNRYVVENERKDLAGGESGIAAAFLERIRDLMFSWQFAAASLTVLIAVAGIYLIASTLSSPPEIAEDSPGVPQPTLQAPSTPDEEASPAEDVPEEELASEPGSRNETPVIKVAPSDNAEGKNRSRQTRKAPSPDLARQVQPSPGDQARTIQDELMAEEDFDGSELVAAAGPSHPVLQYETDDPDAPDVTFLHRAFEDDTHVSLFLAIPEFPSDQKLSVTVNGNDTEIIARFFDTVLVRLQLDQLKPEGEKNVIELNAGDGKVFRYFLTVEPWK